MRRAKIVCTLGPATEDAVMIDRMIAAGMNMARLNLSHGAREGHEKTFEMVRQAAAKADLSVAIVVDLGFYAKLCARKLQHIGGNQIHQLGSPPSRISRSTVT